MLSENTTNEGNSQNKVYDMISDDHYYVGVRLHFEFLSFFQVLSKNGNGEDDQENIKAYDRDGSIYRRHGPDATEDRAVRHIWSYNFLHYATRHQLAKNSIKIEIHL
jgi:hypothetical protein